ncbi:MAG: hypothetical protein LBM38_03405 [Clostridiales bacterium]|jgi:aspartate kinase|nr:hypothetical protein [Clostridiales bacterium]
MNITTIKDETLIILDNIPNDIVAVSEVWSAIGDNKIVVDMISQTLPYKDKIAVIFTTNNDEVPKVVATIGELKSKHPNLLVEINADNTKFVLQSSKFMTTSGVAAKIYKALKNSNIYPKLITTSDDKIELLFDANEQEDVENAFANIEI